MNKATAATTTAENTETEIRVRETQNGKWAKKRIEEGEEEEENPLILVET